MSKVLVLRTSDENLRSHNGFQWPESGFVECRDWLPTAECGNGLHGLLWGEGNGSLLLQHAEGKWQILEVESEGIIPLGGKVKFQRANVVHTGSRESAIGYLLANGGAGKAVVFSHVTAGDHGTATAGYYGKATAGNHGTATAGNHGTATAGDHGTATAGDHGTATAGYYGKATAGYGGTATAGDQGTATAGDRGTATAGDQGTATAGYYSTATAGDQGTATAGYYSTATAGDHGTATAGDFGTATAGDQGAATAGDRGTIQIQWWDDSSGRYRISTGYVGEGGVEANRPYRIGENGQLIKV